MLLADITNKSIGDAFDEVATLLEAQDANPFRVRAWRNGAETIRRRRRPVHEIFDEHGIDGLKELPGIGTSLANAVCQLVISGRLPLLEQLRGDLAVEKLFSRVPGIGPMMAAEIHHDLHIETLGELHAAAFDGRLDGVPGMGPKRVQAVRDFLANRFRTSQQVSQAAPEQRAADQTVPVAELLDIDAEYRRRAMADQLIRIAPRKFNPTHVAWLPILHAARSDRHYTALFSNTARAHELGMTDDWVVIYQDDEHGHGQWTVVTARYGDMKGRRIVRGRESDCRRHYEC